MAGTTGRMLDSLQDRILILNRASKVVYANAAARSDFDGTLSGLLSQAELRQALTNVFAGRQSTPARLNVKHPNGNTVPVTLVDAPNGTDTAVIVHTQASEHGAQPIDGRTVAELMRQHLHQPLQAFVNELKTEASTEPGTALLERLEKVLDLIAVFGGDALIGDERLLPKSLIEKACQETLHEGLRGRVRIALTGFDTELPPIYGSQRWIQRALKEIIDNAVQQSAALLAKNAMATVEISARQNGEFLTLQFVNHGAYTGTAASSSFVPFTAGKDGKQAATRIGLPLAQRIVELHGGTLKLRSDEDAAATEVTVQLPTGAPRFTSGQLDSAQVKRYAEDLAKLMARRRKEKNASPETAR